MAVDWTDPCARAIALRDAYYRALSGDQEIEIEARSGDGYEHVKFNKADLTRLEAEWKRAEDECAVKCGKTPTPRRHAMTLGARGRRCI